jgi:imidazolonepropionase-like amidohydrolase
LTFHTDSTWREIDYWVSDFGFEVMDAIRAATYWPSVMMGVSDEVGTLAEGKIADVIAVRGDVLRYPSLLQDVDLVLHRGRRVK